MTPREAYKLAFIQGMSDSMRAERGKVRIRSVDELTKILSGATDDGPSPRPRLRELEPPVDKSYFGRDGYHGLGMANQGDIGLGAKTPIDTGI